MKTLSHKIIVVKWYRVVEFQLSFKIESHVWKNLIFNDYANQAPQKKNREVNPIWVSELSESWAK